MSRLQKRRERVRALDRADVEIGNKALTLWRVRHGLTVSDAAKLIGISRQTVAAMERDGRTPRSVALACAAISAGLPPITSGAVSWVQE